MIEKLKEGYSRVSFHGDSANLDKSLYTVLNVSLPESEENEMLLFNLDLQGISLPVAVPVPAAPIRDPMFSARYIPIPKRGAVRFSFSKYNKAEEMTSWWRSWRRCMGYQPLF